MPYGSLAAVRGRHAAMMGLRVVEAIVSLTSLLLVLRVVGADVSFAPYAMALGSLAMGLVARQLILVPTAREEERSIRDRSESGESGESGEPGGSSGTGTASEGASPARSAAD